MGEAEVGVERLGELALAGDRGEVHDRVGAGDDIGEGRVVRPRSATTTARRRRPQVRPTSMPAHVVPGVGQAGRQAAADAAGGARDRDSHRPMLADGRLGTVWFHGAVGSYDDEDPGLPLKLWPCSNGEYLPAPLDDLRREAMRRGPRRRRRARPSAPLVAPAVPALVGRHGVRVGRPPGVQRRAVRRRGHRARRRVPGPGVCGDRPRGGDDDDPRPVAVPVPAGHRSAGVAARPGRRRPDPLPRVRRLGDRLPAGRAGPPSASTASRPSTGTTWCSAGATPPSPSSRPSRWSAADPLSIDAMAPGATWRPSCADDRVLIQGHAVPDVGPLDAALASTTTCASQIFSNSDFAAIEGFSMPASDGHRPLDARGLLVNDRLEPTPTVGRRPIEQPEEELLQPLCHGTALAFADG